MSGINRYMRLLDLFTEDQSSWSVAELSAALGTSASTLYRLVRELVAAGLLESTVEARYRLGPRLIEYERRIRLTDPLIRSGALFLAGLVQHTGLACIAVLARLYGHAVMCVAEAKADGIGFKTSYERGRPMPLVRGATSKAILACVTTRQLVRLLDAENVAEGPERQDLLHELAGIRKTGVALTRGEVDRGVVGIAGPVRNKALGIYASLSVIISADDLTPARENHLFALIASHAKLIETFMEEAHRQDAER